MGIRYAFWIFQFLVGVVSLPCAGATDSDQAAHRSPDSFVREVKIESFVATTYRFQVDESSLATILKPSSHRQESLPWLVDKKGMGLRSVHSPRRPLAGRHWFMHTRADYRWDKFREIISGSFSGTNFDCGRSLPWSMEHGLMAEFTLGFRF